MEATKENFPDHRATHKNKRWGFEALRGSPLSEARYVDANWSVPIIEGARKWDHFISTACRLINAKS
jgi:hypothetical protein